METNQTKWTTCVRSFFGRRRMPDASSGSSARLPRTRRSWSIYCTRWWWSTSTRTTSKLSWSRFRRRSWVGGTPVSTRSVKGFRKRTTLSRTRRSSKRASWSARNATPSAHFPSRNKPGGATRVPPCLSGAPTATTPTSYNLPAFVFVLVETISNTLSAEILLLLLSVSFVPRKKE